MQITMQIDIMGGYADIDSLETAISGQLTVADDTAHWSR
jgi:hypothetical protein